VLGAIVDARRLGEIKEDLRWRALGKLLPSISMRTLMLRSAARVNASIT